MSLDGWEELLTQTGLVDVKGEAYKINALSNRKEDLKDLLRVWRNVLYLYFSNSDFRKLMHEVMAIPKDLLEYFGYGIYVGRKREVVPNV